MVDGEENSLMPPVEAPVVPSDDKKVKKKKQTTETKEQSIKLILDYIFKKEQKGKFDFFEEIRGKINKCEHQFNYDGEECEKCRNELEKELKLKMKSRVRKVL
jgi:hypothetical protein